MWTEKIDIVNPIPELENSLSYISSWRYLEYNHDEATNFLECIKEYGKHLKNIRLPFSKENPDSILQLLKDISNKCINLTKYKTDYSLIQV
jgi:hypothetical protein